MKRRPAAGILARSALALSVLALPGLGRAHDGHPHAGDPLTHHLVECLLAAVFAAAAAWCVRVWRRRARVAAGASGRTSRSAAQRR